jgi:AcrR family transcriptional regulator
MYEMSNRSIWTDPPPGSRKPKLSREAIADAALALVDADGFDALSMRRVATELDVGTMTLYHYLRSKDDLLALMTDRMMAEVLIPEDEVPEDWRPALAEIARRSRNSWRKHPWMHTVQGVDVQVGPNMMRHVDQSLGAVSGLGLTPAEQFELVSMIDDYVLGYVIGEDERAEMLEGNWSQIDSMASVMEEHLSTGDYPNLEAFVGSSDQAGMIAAWRKVGEEMLTMDLFERGLDRLLDGIQLDLERRGKLPS